MTSPRSGLTRSTPASVRGKSPALASVRRAKAARDDDPGPNSTAPRQPTWIIPFILGCAILSGRVAVLVPTGGQGTLPLVAVAAPLAAVFAIWRYGSTMTLGFTSGPAFVLGVAPFLILAAVLPILGVIVHEYPVRTLFTVTTATTPLSFLVLGAAVSSHAPRAWRRWLLAAIAIQLVYALGQTNYWSRGPGWAAFSPFAAWDLSWATLQGQLDSLGRPTGLYTNPNELGLWAAVAVVLSATMLASRQRGVGIALSLMTLLLSQSRGAAAALLAALATGVALALVRGRLFSASALQGMASFVLAGAAAILVGIFVATPDVLLDRFGALMQVASGDLQADTNLAGRINFWSNVISLNRSYPLGTLGSPELILGSAVDSDWFRAFAQGSVPYLATLILLILTGLTLRSTAYGDTLRLCTVVVAVAGATQTPLNSPVIVVFWALLGIYIQTSTVARNAAPPHRPMKKRQSRGNLDASPRSGSRELGPVGESPSNQAVALRLRP